MQNPSRLCRGFKLDVWHIIVILFAEGPQLSLISLIPTPMNEQSQAGALKGLCYAIIIHTPQIKAGVLK